MKTPTRDTLRLIVQTLLAFLTALATTLGVSSCKGCF